MSEAGKGDKNRVTDFRRFWNNLDRIDFRRKKDKSKSVVPEGMRSRPQQKKRQK